MSDRLSDEQIAEGLRLAEAATPGPWTFGGVHVGSDNWFPFDQGHCLYPPSQQEAGLDYQPGGPVAMVSDGEFDNTPFIAAARTLLPAALNELSALRQRLAAVEAGWRAESERSMYMTRRQTFIEAADHLKAALENRE